MPDLQRTNPTTPEIKNRKATTKVAVGTVRGIYRLYKKTNEKLRTAIIVQNPASKYLGSPSDPITMPITVDICGMLAPKLPMMPRKALACWPVNSSGVLIDNSDTRDYRQTLCLIHIRKHRARSPGNRHLLLLRELETDVCA